MKKFLIGLIFGILCIMPVTVSANTPLGDAVYTDIVTYINHYPIPSYNFNGITLIAAEDLQSYGFNVFWNEYARTLTINRDHSNNDILAMPTFRPLESQLGKKNFTVTTTDVSVYTGNYKYSSFGGIAGKTLINVNDLVCIDNVSVAWVPEVKAVKLWVTDGLKMSDTPFAVRRLDENFTYYESCYGLETWYHWQWKDSPAGVVITIAETDGENSYTCTDCWGKIKVVDVIDADGNSRLKNKSLYESGKPSVFAYFYDLSDYALAHTIFIDNSDLYPNKAASHGGLIKIEYNCTYGGTFEKTIRVDCLPYE